MINISKCNKAAVLKALYDNAQPLGMGYMQYTPEDMTLEEAEEALKTHTYFDYHKGRVMKVDLRKDTLDPYLYDRDNGQDAAYCALKAAGLI
jgi:hypothetical protein